MSLSVPRRVLKICQMISCRKKISVLYNLCLPFRLYSFFLPVCFRYIWCTPFKGSAEDPNFRDSQLIMLPSTFQLQSNSPRLVALENIGTGNIGVEHNSNGVIRKLNIKEPTYLPFISNNRVL